MGGGRQKEDISSRFPLEGATWSCRWNFRERVKEVIYIHKP